MYAQIIGNSYSTYRDWQKLRLHLTMKISMKSDFWKKWKTILHPNAFSIFSTCNRCISINKTQKLLKWPKKPRIWSSTCWACSLRRSIVSILPSHSQGCIWLQTIKNEKNIESSLINIKIEWKYGRTTAMKTFYTNICWSKLK